MMQTGLQQPWRIRKGETNDFPAILSVINDAAEAYRGVIPVDRWQEPYMPAEELHQEIADGVVFWCAEANQTITGVMGIQSIDGEVALIRHAYVRPEWQGQGFGSRLLAHLQRQSALPYLVGTWAAAEWAIRFYQQHGFQLVSPEEKNRLLDTYWTIPARQRDTSVVLADRRWLGQQGTFQ